MDKKTQDLTWACLPKEARNHIRSDYEYYLKRYGAVNANTAKGAIDALEDLFGHHNLTSDTEPEEMLHCSRDFVMCRYRYLTSSIAWDDGDARAFQAEISLLKELFGDKCLPDKESSVQVEPKFKYNIGDLVTYKGKIKKVISRDLDWSGAIMYTCSLLNGQSPLRFEEECLEPYTEAETKELIASNPEAKDETKDNMEEKETLKEKYWKNGNIFELSTGVKRFVWENQLVDARGYIPKGYFNENLVNTDSTIGEKVIRVYSPNTKAGYFKELIETKEENLLWEKSKFIFTEEEIKEELGIPEEKELIIVK